MLHKKIFNLWYRKKIHPILFLLIPASLIYYLIIITRKFFLNLFFKNSKIDIPIIIIGNITVGGVGKTPLVLYFAKLLKSMGLRPAVIIRGFGVNLNKIHIADSNDSANKIGDEAKLLANNLDLLKISVLVGKNRVEAVRIIKKYNLGNVIISDDGLQHYKLARDFEIAVVDNKLKFGNKLLLPAGPLREPVSRLKSVDLILSKNEGFKLNPIYFYNMYNNAKLNLNYFYNKDIVAICAIGNPDGFFSSLINMGINLTKKISYPDHYKFKKTDFEKFDNFIIIMTEKDSVKCESFNLKNIFYLKVEAVLTQEVENKLKQKLYDRKITKQKYISDASMPIM